MRRSVIRLALAALAVAGCGTDPVATPGAGDYQVRVGNAGDVALRDLVVYVSASDSLRLGDLARGTTSDYRAARASHEYPIVRATVDGRSLVAHPVEGFVPGFNRVLEPGRYTYTVAVVTSEGSQLLDVRVRRD